MTYLKTLKKVSYSLLTTWRVIPDQLKETWKYFKEFSYYLAILLLVIILPLLLPFSPVVAYFVLRAERAQEARRQEMIIAARAHRKRSY